MKKVLIGALGVTMWLGAATLLMGIGGNARKFVRNGAKTVGTTIPAEKIASAGGRTDSYCIKNIGTADVYIGNKDVTTSNGFPVSTGATYCDDGEISNVYAVVAAGTEDIRWIASD